MESMLNKLVPEVRRFFIDKIICRVDLKIKENHQISGTAL